MLRPVAFALLSSLLLTLGACADDGASDDESASGSSTGDSGCGADCTPLADGFVDELTNRGGCGDVFLAAYDSLGILGVELSADGLAPAALAAGEVTVSTFALPDAALDLAVRTGHHLDAGFCTDYVEDERIVQLEYRPVSGSLTLTITPAEGEAKATAEFTDIVWKVEGRDDIPAVTTPTLVIADAVVGVDPFE